MVWNIVIGGLTMERTITWSTVGELPRGTPSEEEHYDGEHYEMEHYGGHSI